MFFLKFALAVFKQGTHPIVRQTIGIIGVVEIAGKIFCFRMVAVQAAEIILRVFLIPGEAAADPKYALFVQVKRSHQV